MKIFRPGDSEPRPIFGTYEPRRALLLLSALSLAANCKGSHIKLEKIPAPPKAVYEKPVCDDIAFEQVDEETVKITPVLAPGSSTFRRPDHVVSYLAPASAEYPDQPAGSAAPSDIWLPLAQVGLTYSQPLNEITDSEPQYVSMYYYDFGDKQPSQTLGGLIPPGTPEIKCSRGFMISLHPKEPLPDTSP